MMLISHPEFSVEGLPIRKEMDAFTLIGLESWRLLLLGKIMCWS